MRRFCVVPSVAALVACVLASPAVAHHVNDGRLPETWFQGLLSGLAHPVIGLDHLAFIVALGLVAAFLRNGLQVACAFMATGVAGVVLHLGRVDLPFNEALIGVSILVAGLIVLTQRSIAAGLWLGFAAAAGLVHGLAFGEAIAGARSGIVMSYIAGLLLTQVMLVAAVKTFTEMVLIEDQGDALRVRAAGGAFVAIGLFFVTTALVQV